MLPSTLASNAYVSPAARDELNFTAPIKLGAKKLSARRVQEHLTLNGFALSIDSDFGPATEKRVKDFQSAKSLSITGVVDMATWEALVDPIIQALKPIPAGSKSLSQLILMYTRQHVKARSREAGGDNCGPWVRTYLGWDGKDARWCAGFVSYAMKQAAFAMGVTPPIKGSSSCDELASQANSAGKYVKEQDVIKGKVPKSSIVAGSFFLVRRVSNDWTHVGIVSEASATTFDTVEGNTDSAGSSNGFEAAERTRNYAKKDFIIW